MTTTSSPTSEPTLADPVAVLDLPPVDEMHDLYRRVTVEPPRRRVGPAFAAAGVLTAAASAAIIALPGGTDHAAALGAAADATSVIESGRVVVEQEFVGADSRLDQVVVLDFAGDDYRITFSNEGGVITGDGAFTPETMEVRSVDGAGFIKVDDEPWHETVSHPTYEALDEVGARLSAAAAAADDLDVCSSSGDGRTAYCFATDDVDLVHVLRPVSTLRFTSIEAEVRVEIDEATGVIAAIAIDATDAVVDAESHPGVIPVLDLRSTTTLDVSTEPTEIAAPEMRTSPRPTSSLTPAEAFNPIVLGLECQHLHEQDRGPEVITCLQGHGFHGVAEYYASVFEIEIDS